ncbi:hypothetical protein PoB_005826800 [Plakobranchus ocellatus]|uniref:Uncharacterized protein n=1 Tax=Plakobranchus ocellatus TaxID=259542 RepID=A0AAV4CIF0_9GAST|nr:hypothetical protein PoB_005826800 [Plakobranchus ocellatus]
MLLLGCLRLRPQTFSVLYDYLSQVQIRRRYLAREGPVPERNYTARQLAKLKDNCSFMYGLPQASVKPSKGLSSMSTDPLEQVDREKSRTLYQYQY